jgi:2-polyprenyl-3-methyl-5-hydroxy-6-metoxy-1,4-benzoquinol methylase
MRGAGAFAARLAQRADCVDALDSSPDMIAAAQPTVPENVTCVPGDVCEVALPAGAYDAITSISALHHMPLPQVLPRLAAALRPGGVLVAVVHHRVKLPRDLLAHAVSTLAVYGRRAILLCIPRPRRYRRELVETGMPVKDPELTVRQVRQQAGGVLPGARVRRLVLWRYELVWRKPVAAAD